MTMSLLFDGVLTLLLTITIGFAVLLNHRLTHLRRARVEFQALIDGFGAATAEVRAAIEGLKESDALIGAPLRAQLGSARALRDDLDFLIKSGNQLADRTAAMHSSRGVARSAPASDRVGPDRVGPDRKVGAPISRGPSAAQRPFAGARLSTSGRTAGEAAVPSKSPIRATPGPGSDETRIVSATERDLRKILARSG